MKAETIENWLSIQNQQGILNIENSIIVDVGAYQGKFTLNLLNNHLCKAVLFEPNPDNFAALQNNFNDFSNVEIQHLGISDKAGTMQFYCNDILATGSILPYGESWLDLHPSIKEQVIPVTTLDQFFQTHVIKENISILKIDTQGNDLNVLRGAEQTIRTHQSAIIIELNFVDKYVNQGHYLDIFSWFHQHNYSLRALFDIHYSTDHWLAYADGIFLPNNIGHQFTLPYYINSTNADLLLENIALKKVCEERMELINQLESVCNERIQIMNEQQSLIHQQNNLLRNKNSSIFNKVLEKINIKKVLMNMINNP